jgi:Anti-sigma-K factor rskA
VTDPTCPRNEQAVGWALHSLEPDEEMAVLMHLPHCDSCRKVAGEAEEVLSHLGVAVEQVDPPPSLRDRLMAKVADTPQQPEPTSPAPNTPAPTPPNASPQERNDPAGTPTAVPSPRRDNGSGRIRPPDNRPGRGSAWSRRGRRILAGALALVAMFTIGGLALRNAQLEAERDARIAQAQNLENLLDQLDRPDVEHALLARDDGSTVAAVVVENGRPQVFPIGIPINSLEREIYVLWGIAEGATSPSPLGTFDVTVEDASLLPVVAAPESGDYAAYAISLEPGRTAPSAPSAVLASGPVSA